MRVPTNPPRAMRGSTVSADGASGYVPAPAIADRAKYLRGDGTWATGAVGGDMLAANNLADVANVEVARQNLRLSPEAKAPRGGVISTGASAIGTTQDNTGLAFGTADVTVGFWARLSDWTPSSGKILWSKGDIDFNLQLSTTGILIAVLDNGAGSFSVFNSTASVGVTDGAWAFIVTVFDRDGNLTFYVNGAQLGTPVSIAALSAVSITSASPLKWFSSALDTTLLAGTLGETFLINGLLTSTQVSDIYKAGSIAPFAASFTFFQWCDFGQGYGPLIRDRSGRNQHAFMGSSGLTHAIPNVATYAASQEFSSRSGADYLQSDGATVNRRIETVYGGVGAVAGSDLTVADVVFDAPTSNPSATAMLWCFSTLNTSSADFIANALTMAISVSGELFIVQYGATTGDRRLFLYSGWRAANSGRRVRITAALTGNSTSNPVVYQDGVDISSNFVMSTTGTAPNWLHSSQASAYFLQGVSWPAGYFRPGRPVNRKYAQSDVDFVQLTGRLPAGDASGGSAVELLANGNFSSDPTVAANGRWTLDAGVAWNSGTGKVDFATAGAAFMRGSTSQSDVWSPSNPWNHRERPFWRVAFTISNYAAGSIRLTDSAGSPLQQVDGTTVPAITANGTYSYDVITTPTTFQFMLGSVTAAPLTFSVDDFSIKRIGALSDPIVQPCQVLDDATQNNRASLLVGFTPVTTRKDWRIPAWVDMSSTGNKQLLSGALFFRPLVQAIDTIETTCAGTPTFSIGDGTTATKYTASVAHTATRLRETVSANFPADNTKSGIYANVTAAHASSTAELIIVRGHRE